MALTHDHVLSRRWFFLWMPHDWQQMTRQLRQLQDGSASSSEEPAVHERAMKPRACVPYQPSFCTVYFQQHCLQEELGAQDAILKDDWSV